jgi:S-adenosylmethionine:tRNA ribosyltransferase-isomerase
VSRLSDYEYELPSDLIAQCPLEERTASRLLCLDKRTGEVQDRKFTDLADLLNPEDLLVLNDTRVTALRLYGTKPTGAAVEALLLNQTSPGSFVCLLKPARRLPLGTCLLFPEGLTATVEQILPEGMRLIKFQPVPDLEGRIRAVGEVPLPPYIKDKLEDPERYQTVVASQAGSAAAPTAALHFTQAFLGKLKEKGVKVAQVTLTVGIDTFRPVQVEDLDEHVMHGEWCNVPPVTAEQIAGCNGRVIAVGTTSVRTLESFATGYRNVSPGSKATHLFIQPGHVFRVVDGMLTNFHLPRTTMLLMISALAGREHVLEAYRHAVRQRYRFLSFGDSMLIS